MNCNSTRELLPWLGVGSLAADEASAMRAHLASCGECRRDWNETRQAFEILGQHLPSRVIVARALGLPSDELDPETVDRHLELCSECRHELELVRSEETDSRRTARPFRTLAWAASVAAVVAVGALMRPSVSLPSGDRVDNVVAEVPSQPSASDPVSRSNGVVFADGFESSSLGNWSAVSGAVQEAKPKARNRR